MASVSQAKRSIRHVHKVEKVYGITDPSSWDPTTVSWDAEDFLDRLGDAIVSEQLIPSSDSQVPRPRIFRSMGGIMSAILRPRQPLSLDAPILMHGRPSTISPCWFPFVRPSPPLLPVHYDKIFPLTLFFSSCGRGLVSSGSREGLTSPATVSQWSASRKTRVHSACTRTTLFFLSLSRPQALLILSFGLQISSGTFWP